MNVVVYIIIKDLITGLFSFLKNFPLVLSCRECTEEAGRHRAKLTCVFHAARPNASR